MTGEVARSGWWRTNLFPLIALGVVGIVAIVLFNAVEVARYRNATQEVAEGESFRVADWGFGPVTVEPLDPTMLDVPSASAPIKLIIRVDPGHDEMACYSPVVREPSTGREWRTSNLGWVFTEDEQTYCFSQTVVPYDLVSTVLLPGDADGPFVVKLTTVDAERALDLHFLGVD